MLQAQFVQTDALVSMLAVVGNMTGENTTTNSDDGITQQVAVKAGIHLQGRKDIQNPINLKPFRTFREVEQPESPFVLRVRQSREGQVPSCALFEADGGAWKLVAMNRVRDHLKLLVSNAEIPVKVFL